MLDFTILSDYLSAQADWWAARASEQPGDERNLQASESLRFAASYVRTLDPGDIRLQILEACTDDLLPFMPGLFDVSHDRSGEWLDRLTLVVVRDTIKALSDQTTKHPAS